MAKAGMRRYITDESKKKHRPDNEMEPVPEIQGKAKETKKKAKPLD